MARDLTTSSPSTISLREAEVKIAELHGRLEPDDAHPNRFCVRSDRAVTTIERRQLCAVRDRLEQQLAPASKRSHVEAVVNRLLLGFDLGRGPSEENATTLNNEFVEACAGLPLAAIHAAAERFRTATTLRAWNPAYRPNPGQFADEAREGMIPMRRQVLHIRRILEAEVYEPPTPEQIAAVEQARKDAAAYLSGRQPEGAARPVLTDPGEGPRPAPDVVAPLRGLDASHLMDRLDRKRVSA